MSKSVMAWMLGLHLHLNNVHWESDRKELVQESLKPVFFSRQSGFKCQTQILSGGGKSLVTQTYTRVTIWPSPFSFSPPRFCFWLHAKEKPDILRREEESQTGKKENVFYHFSFFHKDIRDSRCHLSFFCYRTSKITQGTSTLHSGQHTHWSGKIPELASEN